MKRDWGALIEEQERSGLSQRQFCRERGLSLGSFQHQRYKFRRVSRSEFIELSPKKDSSLKELEFILGENLRVRVPLDISSERLSELVGCFR